MHQQNNEEMKDVRPNIHQPNIIGNIEDMSLQDSVEDFIDQTAQENGMFSKSKSKSITRKQSKINTN